MVLGEVKSVSDSEITIAVGTMKEMGQPGGDGQNGGAPDGNGQGGDAPSGRMARRRRNRKVTDRM